MRYRNIFLAAAVICLATSCANQDSIDKKVNSLLAKMTLEEKIGQMNQVVSATSVMTGPGGETVPAHEAIKKGWCGSMLNVATPEDNRYYQKLAVDSTRLGIPLLIGYDIIHGCKTIFPINLGCAASWDIPEIQNAASIAAMEASALGIAWTFSPMCDICAEPRWGRVSEGAGEDTFLGSRVSEAMVRGYQGEDLSDPRTILACVKHFAAYGAPEAGREYNTVDMSRRMFHDKYLPPYRAAIDAGAGSVMSSFNDFEGIPVSASEYIMRTVLRDECGFEGFVVSDWAAVHEISKHGVAADDKDAALLGAKAGVNMDMVSGAYLNYLMGWVKSGKISEREIDDLVRPILRMKYELGLFDDPYRYGAPDRQNDYYTAESLDAARRLARKSMVLLQNNGGVLPLKDNARIALVGPFADSKLDMLGSWFGLGDPAHTVTFLEGLKARFGNVSCEQGCAPHEAIPGGIRKAVAVASRSDVVLVTMGLIGDESGEATSLTSISIPDCQKDLLRALKATGKPVVILLVTGRPMDLTEEVNLADAILLAWYPGTMAGPALADLVSGDYAPSGRLSICFPESLGQVPIRYNAKSTGRPAYDPVHPVKFESGYMYSSNLPRYTFGYGLSYTDFEYSDLEVLTPAVKAGEDVRVSVCVRNIGGYDAEETVQLYIHDEVASTTRPTRELKAFEKVFLKAGESAKVTLTVKYPDLAFYTINDKYEVESGDFTVFVGHDANASLTGKFVVK